MTDRLAQFVSFAVGIALFGAAMVYPALMLILRSVTDDHGASGPFEAAGSVPLAFLPWRLLIKSSVLAAGGAALAVLLSLPAAYLIGRTSRVRPAGWMSGVILVPMLFPAMVYAFGWQRIVGVPDELRCVWVWASWSWPIPALLIGSGWSRLGRRVYEEALIATSGGQAFVRVVLPALSRHVGISALVLFALFLGEYSVPHACGLQVYATALLSSAEACIDPMDTLWPSLPVVGVIVVAGAVAVWLWKQAPVGEQPVDESGAGKPSVGLHAVVVGLSAGCVLVPVLRLADGVDLAGAMRLAVETYGRELFDSFAVALLSGFLVVVMGMCVCTIVAPRLRTFAIGWSMLLAAIPGALVGQAVVVGYHPIPVVYDYWPLVVVGYVARFGWVGILVAWIARSSMDLEQWSAARVDGAGEWTAVWRIALLPSWAMLASGMFVVAALSLSEVAMSSLVRVPQIGNIAMILIDKFHVQEDAMLVSLSVWLVAAAVPGAVLTTAAMRRWK